MSEIKSLADQLRNKIAPTMQATVPKKKPPDIPPILQALRDYDNRNHRSLAHIRFDVTTMQTMNHFKMATGVDMTKLVAFAVAEFFQLHPELKTIIKQFIQDLEL
ncbi:MAG: hypothetical protein ACHQHN_04325 [Sphingobacteriales bacterium]